MVFFFASEMSAHIRFGFPILQGAPGLGNLQNLRRIWIPRPVMDSKLASLEFPTDPRSGENKPKEKQDSKMPVGFEETYRKAEADSMDKDGTGRSKPVPQTFEDIVPQENKMKVEKTTLEEMMHDYFESKLKARKKDKKKKKRKYVLISDSDDEGESGDEKHIFKKFKTMD